VPSAKEERLAVDFDLVASFEACLELMLTKKKMNYALLIQFMLKRLLEV
jgi:hypothetical protein